MIDLFRYIEQSFVIPSAKIEAISVESNTDFQTKTKEKLTSGSATTPEIRKLANDFIDTNYSATGQVFKNGNSLLAFHKQLLNLSTAGKDQISKLAEKIFGSPVNNIVGTDDIQKDTNLLNDLLIAVKMSTGFGKVPAADMVKMRQAIAFLTSMNKTEFAINSSADIRTKLLRPILIPSVFLKKPVVTRHSPDPALPDPNIQYLDSLKKEEKALGKTYEALLSLQPSDLHFKKLSETPTAGPADQNLHALKTMSAIQNNRDEKQASTALYIPVLPNTLLTIHPDTELKLDDSVKKTLRNASIDLQSVPLSQTIDIIKNKWTKVSNTLQQGTAKGPAKIYQLGVHSFAIQDLPDMKTAESSVTLPATFPDFSQAITRPIGLGNLQLVRQELVGYEKGEISHIQNVLHGELLRNSSVRLEENEVTTTDENITTQIDERDLQSTDRNEMVSETQKEAGKQTSSTQDQTSTSSYGKLVENSKTDYARSVTDRAASSLTQQVRRQRIVREKKTFTESARHEYDNREAGSKDVIGIYQWVDKKYKTKIVNYGTRLLYDVVLPEPAAFLIETLKAAPQPEGFELFKPITPWFGPDGLNVSNYMGLSGWYGVSGSVTPPPDEFLYTVAKPDSPDPKGDITFKPADYSYLSAYAITIPQGYQAVSGYIETINPTPFLLIPDRLYEVFIGGSYYTLFGSIPGAHNFLNTHFIMANETGQIPVTMRTFANIFRFSMAIGILCKRTDHVYEQWQLKTHAAIIAGYNRQQSEYQDKLSKYRSLIQSQVSMATHYAHNPAIERAELKKSFIALLMSEHFGTAYVLTPDPLQIPPDPKYVKKWGAMVAFFERAFEWENIMYTFYPYFWGRPWRWGELILIQDINPQFEEFLKAGAARLVVPVRPGFEAALAHFQETGDIWMGEEIPDMFSELYVSIIEEIKARNYAPGTEICVAEWDTKLPTMLVMLKEDSLLPEWKPTPCNPL